MTRVDFPMQSISLLRLSRRRLEQLRSIFRSYAYSTSDSVNHETYDVVVVGGGPAGLSLISALRSSSATNGLRVALVEGMDLTNVRKWAPQPGTFSNRTVSLTPGSVDFLSNIGAWRHVIHDRIQSYNGMKVWDGVSGSKVNFSADLVETASTIAYICENPNLVYGLLQHLDNLSGAIIHDKTKVESISFGTDTPAADLRTWPVVQLSSGKRLAARLLVGADGANSPVRTFAGIETRGRDYGRVGVVATLKLAEGTGTEGDKIAYQRFLPTGPVAMLPFPGDYASLVWSTTLENAAALKAMGQQDFAAMVNAAFRLGYKDLDWIIKKKKDGFADEVQWRESVTQTDSSLVPPRVVNVQEKTVASFPLKLRHADNYITDRIALVGDAAHSIHPLAGQGLNQGIGDVRSLMKMVETAIYNGQDIGAELSLKPYFSEQYFKNNVMLGVVDKLHRLYGTDFAPMVAVRSLGLEAVNALDSLKGFVMDQVAGK